MWSPTSDFALVNEALRCFGTREQQPDDHSRSMIRTEQLPPAPSACVRPIRAPGTWRDPLHPRSWCTISCTWPSPDAPTGSPLDRYLVGGFAAVVVLPLAVRYLPESLLYLRVTGRGEDARRWIARLRLDPALAETATDDVGSGPGTGRGLGRIAVLFSRRYALTTILFCLTTFASLLVLFGLYTWLPQLMRSAGYELGSALTFLIVLNLGTAVGPLVIGCIADRVGSRPATAGSFVLAIVGIAVLSYPLPIVLLYAAVVLAGVGTVGTQILIKCSSRAATPPRSAPPRSAPRCRSVASAGSSAPSTAGCCSPRSCRPPSCSTRSPRRRCSASSSPSSSLGAGLRQTGRRHRPSHNPPPDDQPRPGSGRRRHHDSGEPNITWSEQDTRDAKGRLVAFARGAEPPRSGTQTIMGGAWVGPDGEGFVQDCSDCHAPTDIRPSSAPVADQPARGSRHRLADVEYRFIDDRTTSNRTMIGSMRA